MLYKHIFSSVEEVDQVLDVISLSMLEPTSLPVQVVCKYLSLGHEDLQHIFCDLGAIIDLDVHEEGKDLLHKHILHASLSDFLIDQR
jgi:hypothetical protein